MMTKLAIIAIMLGVSPFLIMLLSKASTPVNIWLHRYLTVRNLLILQAGGLFAVIAGVPAVPSSLGCTHWS
jgi:hypothetical protein